VNLGWDGQQHIGEWLLFGASYTVRQQELHAHSDTGSRLDCLLR